MNGPRDNESKEWADNMAQVLSMIGQMYGGTAYREKGPAGSGGSTWDSSHITFRVRGLLDVNGRTVSASNFSDGTTGLLKIKAGQSGKVQLFMIIDALEDNLIDNEEFSQKCDVTWDITADDQGALTIGPADVNVGAHMGATWLRLDSINPYPGENEKKNTDYVKVTPKIVGGEQSGGIQPFGVGIEGTAKAPIVKKTFRLNIKPEVPKEKPIHVTVGEPENVVMTAKFRYELGPFAVDKTVPERGSLRDWLDELVFKTLPSLTKDQMIVGEQPGSEDGGKGEKIEVYAYASSTNSKKYNDDLSFRRAKAVIDEFDKMGIPPTIFTKPIPRGEREIVDESGKPIPDAREHEVEDGAWRKVVLHIKHSKRF